MNSILKENINNLSLSFTISSSICAYVISKVLLVPLSWHHYVFLSLTVWLIYTFDHLMDAAKPGASEIIRYKFHKKYFSQIRIAIAVILCLLASLLILLPWQTILSGVFVLAICLGYFVLIRKNLLVKRKKEKFAAFCISMGVVGMVVFVSLPIFEIGSVFIFAAFYLLCLQNLYLFSYFEKGNDKRLGFETEVSNWTKDEFDSSMKGLFVLCFIVSVFILQFGERFFSLFLVFMLMQTVLFVLWNRSQDFQKNERYRFIGDAIFFLPLIALLF